MSTQNNTSFVKRKKVLVISPGVLPIPPYLGGAVENLIYNLHSELVDKFDISYVSVLPPEDSITDRYAMENATFYYSPSINPLEDFTLSNGFELSESSKSSIYADFCKSVVERSTCDLIHIHNEAYLVQPLSGPVRKIALHVNDEVISRMDPPALSAFAASVDQVVACSRYIERSILAAFADAHLSPPPIRVIYNGVNTDVYSRLRIDPDRLAQLRQSVGLSNGPVVLFVGRMIEQKGPHLALRAFRRVQESCLDAQLLFVGAPWYSRDNKSRFVDYIREEAGAQMNVSVRFTGYVNQEDLPYYFAMADVFVCPSIWDDPSPFVAYEAQAMGVPVVGSQRGGIPEIVEHGRTGYCVDVFNIPLFAQKISSLLTNDSIRRKMGSEGRTRINDHFNMRLIAGQLELLYKEMLSRSVP
jgi:spore coat protein SA